MRVSVPSICSAGRLVIGRKNVSGKLGGAVHERIATI